MNILRSLLQHYSQEVYMNMNDYRTLRVADDSAQQIREYHINGAHYCVERVFTGSKAIKDILIQKIAAENLSISN